MNRKRQTSRTLTGSRIYIRNGRFQYFAPEPVIDPKTGKAKKWHVLCPIADGELKARTLLDALLGKQEVKGAGDFAIWFAKWKLKVSMLRAEKCPKDPARKKIWEEGGKALMSALGVIETAFADFDLVQVTPADVATFVDQWEGRRSAQAYRGHLSKFFAWCCRKGLMTTNPAREVEVEAPPKRDAYITHAQYKAIRDALMIGKNGRPTRTGGMVQCYMDLLYLFYQRGTEIRLLRWDDITPEGILFKPTKTEHSSGKKVLVPIGPDARRVLARLREIKKLRSVYLIHTEHGQPYTAHGIGSLFKRAADRVGITGLTLRDIRAKAATDAKAAGYSEEQIQTALAHTDADTTRGYIRSREIPVSQVVLRLPPDIE